MRYRLDPSWWRHSHGSGETIVAGSPSRIFRFTSSAAQFLDDLEADRTPDPSTHALRVRLVDAGAIHPAIDDCGTDDSHTSQPTLDDVTVVIPARVDSTTNLRTLLSHLPPEVAIIVIDDGSLTPIGDLPRAQVVRNDTSQGPAAARNQALDIVRTDFVLFLDSDIVLPAAAVSSDFWSPLLFHMADPSVAVVAPRVCSIPGESVLTKYEVGASPLDMGSAPARVRSGSRVSYVPSAALLVRTRVIDALGGFDEILRYGEDVDLVWRADAAGHVCRYEPMVAVFHEPRTSWRALLEQRFHYGTAAAPLEIRHPASARPLRINSWSAAVLFLAVLGHPVVAAGVAGSTIVRLAQRLRSMPDRWRIAVHLAGRGHLFAARMALEAAVRTWWPLTCVGMVVSRRVRTTVGIFLIGRALETSQRGNGRTSTASTEMHPLDPVRTTYIRVADDIAYGTGVWYGAFRERSARCLLPRLD